MYVWDMYEMAANPHDTAVTSYLILCFPGTILIMFDEVALSTVLAKGTVSTSGSVGGLTDWLQIELPCFLSDRSASINEQPGQCA